MRKRWNWKDDECVRALGTLLIGGKTTYETSELLFGQYENAPSASAIIGQLRRTNLPKNLIRVFSTEDFESIKRQIEARAVSSGRSKKAIEPSLPGVLDAEFDEDNIDQGTTVIAFANEKPLSPEAQWLLEEQERQWFPVSSRFKCASEGCDRRKRPGAGYCEECSQGLYQPAEVRAKADRRLGYEPRDYTHSTRWS